jgi:hypothetical protein
MQLSAIKSEMKALLQSDKNHPDAIQIFLTKEECAQLEWEDEAEFKYNGEMYDLIKKKTNGNKVLITCIADSKETSLLQEFQKHTNKSRSHWMVNQLVTACFVIPHEDSLKRPEKVVKASFCDVLAPVTETLITVCSPPPDVC